VIEAFGEVLGHDVLIVSIEGTTDDDELCIGFSVKEKHHEETCIHQRRNSKPL
jgi:hypothetical protein